MGNDNNSGFLLHEKFNVFEALENHYKRCTLEIYVIHEYLNLLRSMKIPFPIKKEKYLPVCGSTNLSKLYKRAIFFTTLAVLKKIATVIHIQNIHICAELTKKKKTF